MNEEVLNVIKDKQIYEDAKEIGKNIIVEHFSSIMRAGDTALNENEFEEFMYNECAYILFCKMRDREIDPQMLQETRNYLGYFLRAYFDHYHNRKRRD